MPSAFGPKSLFTFYWLHTHIATLNLLARLSSLNYFVNANGDHEKLDNPIRLSGLKVAKGRLDSRNPQSPTVAGVCCLTVDSVSIMMRRLMKTIIELL